MKTGLEFWYDLKTKFRYKLCSWLGHKWLDVERFGSSWTGCVRCNWIKMDDE